MVMPGLIMRPQDWDLLAEIMRGQLDSKTKLWAFGSRVGGKPRPSSDLDLVVFDLDRRACSGLREAFEESNLPFAVDLHVWGELPAEFQARIGADHLDLTAAMAPRREG